jgi:phosphoesterase RecJ-like protein
LLELNVEPVYIYQQLFGTKSLAALQLISMSLATLTVDGLISYMELTTEMYDKIGTATIDLEEIITFAGMVSGIKIFVLFRELKPDTIKVSLRSYDDIDLTKIAFKYGGGGHIHAAGFQLDGDIKSVEQQVLNDLRETYLK